MKNRMKLFAWKCRVIAILIGLTGGLPMPSLHPVPFVAEQTARSQPDSTPALQAEQAIEQLKEQGLYNSLPKAEGAARYDIRLEESPVKDFLSPSDHASKPAQQLDADLSSDDMRLRPSRAIAKDVESSATPDQYVTTLYR